MKFRIVPTVDGWRLDIWKTREYQLRDQEPEHWSFNSYHSYKWQAKRMARHLATPEEVFEIA